MAQSAMHKQFSLLLLHLLLHLLLIITPSHSHGNPTPTDNDDDSVSPTTQRNCRNSFPVLEEKLLSLETNRFKLLKTFFPPRDAHPVFVTVTYRFYQSENRFGKSENQFDGSGNPLDGSENGFGESENRFDGSGNESVWYWSASEVYLVQPLDVLQFTSLFHSNLWYRSSRVVLELDRDCLGTRTDFLEILTQRLKLYAQTQRVSTMSEPLRVSDLYIAVAASRDEIMADSFQSLFARIWLHLVFILFPVTTVIVVYNCDPIQLLLGDKTWQKLRDENNHPRLAAMIQISVAFTLYVFIIDCLSFSYTLTSELYSDHTHSGFYLTTVTGFVVDLAALTWVLIILASSCKWNCQAILQGNCCKKVTSTRIHTLLVSVTVSPLLCGANHLPYIIMSYVSDPYNAGSISMIYFFTFLLFYFIFSQVYSRVVLRTGSRPKNFPYAVTADLVHFPDGDACRRKVRVPFNTQAVMLSLVIVTPLLVLYESLLIVLFWALPIRKTLEDSPTRLYTTYQGTGILIVALLTYNIVLRPSPFSFAGAFDKLGKQLQIPQKLGRKWVRMGDEEKAAVVIRTLYSLGGKGGVANLEVMSPGIDEDVLSSVTMSPVKSPKKKGGAYRRGNEEVRLEAMNSFTEEKIIIEEKENQEEKNAVDQQNKETVV